MLQMRGKRLALLVRFARADPIGQGDVAQMTLRVRRRRERQHVGGLVLAPEAGVEVAHGLVAGKEDDDVERFPDAAQRRFRRAMRQGFAVRQRRGPGGVLDLDLDQTVRPRLAASAS